MAGYIYHICGGAASVGAIVTVKRSAILVPESSCNMSEERRDEVEAQSRGGAASVVLVVAMFSAEQHDVVEAQSGGGVASMVLMVVIFSPKAAAILDLKPRRDDMSEEQIRGGDARP